MGRRLSPEAWAIIAIAAAVILANLPYLLDLFDPNPLGPRSQLLGSFVPGLASGQPTIDPSNGFYSQALGHRAVIDLFGLHLPWWNPYEGTGVPLAGELEAAPFFPPTWFTALGNGQLYEHILLEVVAGLATYKLIRRLEVGRLPAVAAGIAFALNGTFAWFAHAAVNPVAMLPLLLLGIELAFTASAQGRVGGWWLIAVGGALSFYAGFPETAYIDALMALIWLGWRLGCSEPSRRAALLRKGAAGAAVAVLLCAPLLIAMLDYTSHGYLGRHAGGLLGSRHINVQGLPQLLMPYVFGPIFGYTDPHGTLTGIWGSVGGYLSSSLVLFGLLGLFSGRRLSLRLTLLVWISLVLARMYAVPGLGAVLGWLPGMSRVAFYRYCTPALELSVLVLAAMGIQELTRRPARRTIIAWASAGLLLALVAAAVGAHSLTSQLGAKFAHRPYYAASIAWAVLVLAAGAIVTLLRTARTRRILAVALIVVDALVLFAIPEFSAPRAVQLDLAPVSFLKQNLGNSRAFTLGPLQPNYGAYFGLGLLNNNDVPLPAVMERYIHGSLDPWADPDIFVGLPIRRNPFAPPPGEELVRNLPAYQAAAVKYVLTPPGDLLPARDFQLVLRSPSTWIYELRHLTAYFTASGGACQVAPDGRTAAEVSCARPAELIRRETYMPGWSAQVDGHAVPVRLRNGPFQAVDVPAGHHRVTYRFVPPYIGWGALALAAGLIWLAVAGALSRRRRAATRGPSAAATGGLGEPATRRP
jgi:hypothetical protein